MYYLKMIFCIFVIFCSLYLEFKQKGHKKQTTMLRKLIYWVVWSGIIVGNILLISNYIMRLFII